MASASRARLNKQENNDANSWRRVLGDLTSMLSAAEVIEINGVSMAAICRLWMGIFVSIKAEANRSVKRGERGGIEKWSVEAPSLTARN